MLWLPESLRPHHWWWQNLLNVLEGISWQLFNTTHHMYFDALLEGWGAQLNDQVMSGLWSSERRSSHFNVLELKALINTVHQWKQILCQVSLMVAMDTVTVTASAPHTQHLYCK